MSILLTIPPRVSATNIKPTAYLMGNIEVLRMPIRELNVA